MAESKVKEPTGAEFYAARDAFDRKKPETVAAWHAIVDACNSCGLTVKGDKVSEFLLVKGGQVVNPPKAPADEPAPAPAPAKPTEKPAAGK